MRYLSSVIITAWAIIVGDFELTLSLIHSIIFRVLAVALISAPIGLTIAHFTHPIFVRAFAERLALEVAAEMGRKYTGAFESLKAVSDHDLAWCYVTDGAGGVLPTAQPFAPSLVTYEEKSREVEVHECKFFEAVALMDAGEKLHIGLPLHATTTSVSTTAFDGTHVLLDPLSMDELIVFALTELGAVILTLYLSIAYPTAVFLQKIASSVPAKSRYNYEPEYAAFETRTLIEKLNEVLLTESRQSDVKSTRAMKSESKEKTVQKLESSGAHKKLSKPGQQSSEEIINTILTSFDRELNATKTSREFAEKLLKGLHDTFADDAKLGAFFKLDRDFNIQLDAVAGLDDKSQEMLRAVDHREVIKGHFSSAKSADIGPLLIKRLGFEPVATRNRVRRILYFIIKHGTNDLAAFVLFLTNEELIQPDQLKTIERLRDLSAGSYYKLLRIEAAEEADWTDHLTGLRNRQFFNEVITHLTSRNSQRSGNAPYSIVVFTADFQDETLKGQDAEVRDRSKQEIARLLKHGLNIKERIEDARAADCYLTRYQGDEFAAIVESGEKGTANAFADKVRALISAGHNWPSGITSLTVSAGCSTYSGDDSGAEVLIDQARNALHFANDHLGPNKTAHCNDLPPDYSPTRRGSALSGELGVLDCSGLLQSIAATQKTGLLTVDGDRGRRLLMSWEAGKPKQAKLGNLTGLHAITEFVISFESGTFTFKQRAKTSIDNGGADLNMSLDKCLLDSAIAEDHLRLARRTIPNANALVRAVPGIETAFGWLKLQQARDITAEELDAMREVIQLADGTKSLSTIFDTVKFPSYISWRAAFLLVENKLLQVKKTA